MIGGNLTFGIGWWGSNQSASSLENLVGNSAGNAAGNVAGNVAGNFAGHCGGEKSI